MEKLNSYTGTLTYRGIAFFFAFDGKELRLFSAEIRKNEIFGKSK